MNNRPSQLGNRRGLVDLLEHVENLLRAGVLRGMDVQGIAVERCQIRELEERGLRLRAWRKFVRRRGTVVHPPNGHFTQPIEAKPVVAKTRWQQLGKVLDVG